MNNYIIASAMLSMVATASLADDFENNTVSMSFATNNTQTVLDVAEDGVQDIEATTLITSYEMGIFQSDVNGGFAYDFITDEISVLGQYNMHTVVGNTLLYGGTELEYRTTNTDFSEGDFYVTPSIGVNTVFNETLSVFAEVEYSWDMTNDWAAQGGTVEIGMPINLSYGVVVTPSLVRGFDDVTEETNINLDIAYVF